MEALTPGVLAGLDRAGRSLQRDGQVVADPSVARDIVQEALRDIIARRVPLWRRLGVLESTA